MGKIQQKFHYGKTENMNLWKKKTTLVREEKLQTAFTIYDIHFISDYNKISYHMTLRQN